MRYKLYTPGIILTFCFIIISCSREPIPPPEPVINYVTIKQLKDMFVHGTVTIDTNIYIKGIITLTPEFKNAPSFIAYIQDSTAGICLTVTGTNTFTLNSEVKILCRGVTFTNYNGLLQFGDINITDQSELVSLTPTPLTPINVTLAELLAGNHQAEYVAISGVQFKDPGTFSGSKVLTDCNSVIDVYTRSDATFASATLPTGNGILKGIASVYTSQQILIRDPVELTMTGTRCGVPSKTYISQDFATLIKYADVSTLSGWKTYPQSGTKTWYGNNTTSLGSFVQATAYSSGQTAVITWMIGPQIDLTGSVKPYVKFDCADGYDNGATLEFFVSADYTGSATPWANTWTKINFTMPPSTPSGYSQFVSSGQLDLSAYNGSTLFIAWVYKGADPSGTTSDKTTTWEIDNVIVAEK